MTLEEFISKTNSQGQAVADALKVPRATFQARCARTAQVNFAQVRTRKRYVNLKTWGWTDAADPDGYPLWHASYVANFQFINNQFINSAAAGAVNYVYTFRANS